MYANVLLFFVNCYKLPTKQPGLKYKPGEQYHQQVAAMMSYSNGVPYDAANWNAWGKDAWGGQDWLSPCCEYEV